MIDLTHYMRRPTMPLPTEMVEALAAKVTDRFAWTWAQLTDRERDALWAIYPPVVAIATLNAGDADFTGVADTGPAASAAVLRAWQAHTAEHQSCCGEQVYPAADEINVVTGPLRTVWRDGTFYPKGDN